jgi:hypothetical protein
MQYYTFTGKKREKSKTLLFCHAPCSGLNIDKEQGGIDMTNLRLETYRIALIARL